MARIWQEGFEDGLPNYDYLQGGLMSVQNKDWYVQFNSNQGNGYPTYAKLSTGRNEYSLKSLNINGFAALNHVLPTAKNEIYFRTYMKSPTAATSTFSYLIIRDTYGNILLAIYGTTTLGYLKIQVRKSGTLTETQSFTVSTSIFFKIDIYLKCNSSSGAYELRIDDTTIISETAIDTGSLSVQKIILGNIHNTDNGTITIDDIALNDTTGTVNNSWCGSGTIVALKPKAAGNSSQWDTSQGWVKAESGSGTTTLKITGHGLSTNDVIFNVTRNTYSIVTVVDVNTLTTSSIASQAQNDVIVAFTYASTISATSGTTNSLTVISGHTLISGDVTVNTSRSNAIRKVIYVNGNSVYNSYSNSYDGIALGSTITSQASGDSIKTFKVKQYPISNHYEAVNNSNPNPQYSNIQSTTVGDIDLFDMQELVSDKGLPSGSTIVTVACNIYAKENGAGSQIKPVLRSGSTNNEGSAIGLNGGTLQYQAIYNTSPFTSSAWTRSEVDGLEAGVKLA